MNAAGPHNGHISLICATRYAATATFVLSSFNFQIFPWKNTYYTTNAISRAWLLDPHTPGVFHRLYKSHTHLWHVPVPPRKVSKHGLRNYIHHSGRNWAHDSLFTKQHRLATWTGIRYKRRRTPISLLRYSLGGFLLILTCA
jgi:hypothetical protein